MQPVLEWIKKTEENVPDGWSMQARCLPDLEKNLEIIEDKMKTLKCRVSKKAMKRLSSEERAKELIQSIAEPVLDRTQIKNEWDEWSTKFNECVEEHQVEEWKEKYSAFVIGPVDKYNAEATFQ